LPLRFIGAVLLFLQCFVAVEGGEWLVYAEWVFLFGLEKFLILLLVVKA